MRRNVPVFVSQRLRYAKFYGPGSEKLFDDQHHRFGEKPVTPTIVHATLAPDMHALEPTLTRYGYNAKALSELLHIRQAEVRSFLHGQLPPGRTEELHNQLLAAGIPLGDHLSSGSSNLATG